MLFEGVKPAAWYATPLTKNDLRKFRASTNLTGKLSPVTVRLWLPGTLVLARVRSDSSSALKSMVWLSSKTAELNVIAWELALDAVFAQWGSRLTSQTFPTEYLMI